MDWKVLLSIGATVFLAEIGDKTQIAVFAAAIATRRPLEVFIGASLGLVAVTALAVVVSRAVEQVLPMRAVKIAGGFLFVVMGAWMIFSPGE